MAKFRRIKARRAFSGFRSKRSRSGKGSSDVLGLALAGAIYGVGRPYVEGVMPDAVSSALGGYGDEAVLGTVGYFAAKGKLGSNSMIKNLGKAALIIESARVASSFTSTSSGSSTSSDGWN
jgi:hypothetical protein